MYNRSENIGQLRHAVKIYKPVKGRNSNTGGQINTWVQDAEVLAAYDFRTVSDEKEQAGRDSFQTAVNFRIRYRTVSNEMRIIMNDVEYEILSVLPDTMKQFITLETKQVNPKNKEIISTAEGDEWQTGGGDGWEFKGDGS